MKIIFTFDFHHNYYHLIGTSFQKIPIMKNIYFLLFLIFPFLISAQNVDYKKYKNSHFKQLKCGDRQYENSLAGIKSLMKDLELSDPDLFNILDPKYQTFKSERKKGRIIIWSSVAVGGTLLLKSIGGALDQSAPRGDFNTELYLKAAIILGGAGIFIGNKKKPNRRRFIYDFTQEFNQQTQGDQLIFAIQPNVNLGNNSSLGLTFSLRF